MLTGEGVATCWRPGAAGGRRARSPCLERGCVRCGLVRAQKRGDAEDTLTGLSSGWGPGRRWGARFLPRVGPDVALSRMLLS